MKRNSKRNFPKCQAETRILELWWICSELARFIAVTGKEGFRHVCQVAERYVNAVWEGIRLEETQCADLEDAECFLECEGWGWAKKIWIYGDEDEGLALATASAYLQQDGLWETHMNDEGLLAWRCLKAAALFDRKGAALAQITGTSYPPVHIQDKNVDALWSIILHQRGDKSPPSTSDSESDTAIINLSQQSLAFAAWREWLWKNEKRCGRKMRERYAQFRDQWATTNGRRWEPVINTITLRRFETLWESYETGVRRGSKDHYRLPVNRHSASACRELRAFHPL